MRTLMENVPYNTLLAISVNIVLGGVTFPILFKQSGLIWTTLSLILLAIVTDHASEIYISKMKSGNCISMHQQWELEDIVEHTMGKRWRTTLIVTKVIQITQLQLIYMLNMTAFLKSCISSYPLNEILTTILIFLLLSVISIKSESQWLVRFSWISCVVIAAVYVILIGMSFYTGVDEDSFSNLLNNLNIEGIPQLLSNNNLSFHFQLYLPRILKPQDSRKKHRTLSRLAIGISFLYFLTTGILGALYIEKEQITDISVLVNFPNSLVFSILIKSFLIYHLAANISFKLPILRTSLIELLTDKISKEKSQEIARNVKSRLKLALALVVFFFLMVFSTQSQQGYFTTITGSITSFVILYRIPYGLKYPNQARKNKYLKLEQTKHNSLTHKVNYLSYNFQDEMDPEGGEELQVYQQTQKLKKKLTRKRISCSEKFKDVILLLIGYAIFIYGFVFFIVENINNDG